MIAGLPVQHRLRGQHPLTAITIPIPEMNNKFASFMALLRCNLCRLVTPRPEGGFGWR